MSRPVLAAHEGIEVVRDDFLPGGTKTRFVRKLFEGIDELVYASPCEGGAQTAIATVAAELGKRATIFVPYRKEAHPRSLMAKRLGAKVLQVEAGRLNVVQARARAYADARRAFLAPFGLHLPEAEAVIAEAAGLVSAPDEFWCASGSGVLYRSLRRAWPSARGNVVQIGRELKPEDVPGAKVWVYPLAFGKEAQTAPPFPSDPHYDAKAWEVCLREHGPGRVTFWNVTGPAEP